MFQPRDYFPEGLAIEVVREGRVIKPRYTILCMPGTRYQSVPYGPYASFVLVSAQPGRANPTQLYLLLHELGHIGYRNGITRVFGAEFGALQVPFAIAPVLLFASFTSWWMYILTLVLISWAVQSINGGMRIEAEIEADHAALQQLMFLEFCRDSAFSKAASDLLGTDEELFVTDDKRLLNPGNWLRRQIFAKMKKDAGELLFYGDLSITYGWQLDHGNTRLLCLI